MKIGNSGEQPKVSKHHKRRLSLVLKIILLSFLFGLIGGSFSVWLLSKSGLLTETNIFQKTEKVELSFDEDSAVIEAIEKVRSSVVNISVAQQRPTPFGLSISETSSGSGFVIDEGGLILTNKHIVSDSDALYTVIMAGGQNYKATIQAVDPFNDLAILKIEAKNLRAVELGDSDKLKVGQIAIAIGSPFGEFKNTATMGIISAMNRTITASDGSGMTAEQLYGLLQTDAPINPGNSGGPLINLAGQVIGINTAVARDAENLGFAIPINEAKTAIESVKKTGKIIRPMIGIRYITLNPAINQRYDLGSDYGILIYSDKEPAVTPGSPAAKAGLKSGDIITALNGEKIDQDNSLTRILTKYSPGNEVELTIIRDKKELKKTVKLTEMR